MSKLQEFTNFLKTVDLEGYRRKYSKIKILEMDMPKNVQPISLIYKVYWDEKRFISYEDFYKRYLAENKNALEAFRIETTLCESDFYRGLEARIYRTWVGLMTQIHAGYVAEAVFGSGSVKMSEELDHKGADIRVEYKGHALNYQIKKTSFSGVRSPKPISTSRALDGERLVLNYEVPNSDIFNRPERKRGGLRAAYERFIADKRLARLNNGFIVFTEFAFQGDKARLDRLG